MKSLYEKFIVPFSESKAPFLTLYTSLGTKGKPQAETDFFFWGMVLKETRAFRPKNAKKVFNEGK
jgi:hypothetical protein